MFTKQVRLTGPELIWTRQQIKNAKEILKEQINENDDPEILSDLVSSLELILDLDIKLTDRQTYKPLEPQGPC